MLNFEICSISYLQKTPVADRNFSAHNARDSRPCSGDSHNA